MDEFRCKKCHKLLCLYNENMQVKMMNGEKIDNVKKLEIKCSKCRTLNTLL